MALDNSLIQQPQFDPTGTTLGATLRGASGRREAPAAAASSPSRRSMCGAASSSTHGSMRGDVRPASASAPVFLFSQISDGFVA